MSEDLCGCDIATNKGSWHKKRMRREARFRFYGKSALFIAVSMLIILVGSLFNQGLGGFSQTQIKVKVFFDSSLLSEYPARKLSDIPASRYVVLLRSALKERFPEVTSRRELRNLYNLVSGDASEQIKRVVVSDSSLIDKKKDLWIKASSDSDLFNKNRNIEKIPEDSRNLSDTQIGWLKNLDGKGELRTVFNVDFFTSGDSRNPESAGFLGAIVGSLLTLVICFLVVFPLGVATAVFLEEFAGKNRAVDFIEVNINNLAAVPSIVFGLLGLAIYINVMGIPRSSALVGGMTLALMILPVIIITTRTSLKSIPNTIRDAARALGATPLQVVWHHTLPLAMPGIMTGTILGMARAIGETAPLLMIGMVAFIADIPNGFTSPATVMPVQIYLWASSPETGFVEKTAAGILVLLVLLMIMNMLAIILRKKFEVRW
ncbi:MAG: phosphate ABC transporter permease PstA [Rickettsiales bacterium]